MSLNAISTSPSTALPAVNFHPHGHRKGAHVDGGSAASSTAGNGNTSSIGQLPVGASTALFGNLLRSLEQAVGAAASAVSPVGSAIATTAGATAGASTSTAASVPTPGRKQEMQAFVHSLFQALKQDGLSSGGAGGAPATPAVASVAASTATPASGQYQGSLVSSLQTLIQQLGSNGTATAATSTLSATFQNLIQGSNGGAATAPGASNAASNPSSSAALQNFLNGLLQNLQGNGVHALNGVGNNINAEV
jgi:hypothetical protein